MKIINEMETIGLYIHIPFCASKCFYCDFPTMPYQEKRIDEYFTYLFKEIDLNHKFWQKYKVNTIYLGGGTPNYIDSSKILELHKKITNCFNLSKNLEYSIEGNCEFVNPYKIEDYLNIGINRISLGVQTFNDDILKRIGRLHGGDIALKNIHDLKSWGMSNINLDFIMGLPTQTLDNIITDLKLIQQLDINHISYYDLIIERNTRFNYEYKKGNLKLPDEELNREFYHLIIDFLRKIDLNQYEISNFSKKGYQSKHNLKYWTNKKYAAFGLGASGYNGEIRYKNYHKYNDYIDSLKRDILPREYVDVLSIKDKLFEKIIMNMRLTKGVSYTELLEEFNYDIWKDNTPLIDEYEKNNLIKIDKNRISFTEYGFDISNKFFKDLLV